MSPVHGDHGLGLEQAGGMGTATVHREEAAHGQRADPVGIQRAWSPIEEKRPVSPAIEGKAVRHGHDVTPGGALDSVSMELANKVATRISLLSRPLILKPIPREC